MRSRVRVAALAAACCAVLLALAAGPAWAVGTAIILSPKSGPPTTKVAVTGSGFGATETVVVDFDSTQVASATTGSTGSFSTSFTVPKSAHPGNHTVKATGQASGLTATATFLVRTNWPKFGFGLTNSGYNPYENVIGPANVVKLGKAWTGAVGSSGYGFSSPAVANGVAYVGSDYKLYAFSANGTTGCSGTPKTCSPLWTGGTGYYIFSSPAVANGVVYVGSNDGSLYAFSANGTTGCSGTPKTCSPLWTAATNGSVVSSPAVANGVVYVGSNDGSLYAFSANGTTGCSGTPKTCSPLWTAATYGRNAVESAPAVANGVVYVGAFDHDFYAFSANGTTNCSGTPKTCSPLWTGTTGGPIQGSPAVANGVVYVGSGDGKLYAFPAAGTTGCSGTPKTCNPLWTGTTGGTIYASPAVANGVVYLGSGDGKLYAFGAAGTTGCSGTPKTCNPLWTGSAGGFVDASAVVANGVVYVGSAGDGKLYAFSANGTTGCSGTPKTCSPLSTGATGLYIESSPAVANGVVYVHSDDNKLYAFAG